MRRSAQPGRASSPEGRGESREEWKPPEEQWIPWASTMSESRPQPPKNDTISGDNGEGVPPVPIPNTEVKPFSADGTWLDTARESRSSPDSIRSMQQWLILFIIHAQDVKNDYT